MKRLIAILILAPSLAIAGQWLMAMKVTASAHDKQTVHTYLNAHNGTNDWTFADYHVEKYAKANGNQRWFTAFWKWQLPTATMANWQSEVIDNLDDPNAVAIAAIAESYAQDIAAACWTNCVNVEDRRVQGQ